MASVMISRMDFLLLMLLSYHTLLSKPLHLYLDNQQGSNLHLEGKWLQQRQNHFEGVLTFLLLNKNLLEDEANTQKSRTKKWRPGVFLDIPKCLAFVSGMPGTQWVLGCIFRSNIFWPTYENSKIWFLKYGWLNTIFLTHFSHSFNH